jgi:tetratricopeptide (TPR) repeat protein
MKVNPLYYLRHFLNSPSRTLLLLVAVIIFLPIVTYSQQGKIDSLIITVSKSVGIDKFDPLINLAREYAKDDANLEAYKYAKEARIIAYHFGDSLRIVNAGRIMGQLCIRLSNAQEAEEILTKALPVAQRHDLKNDYKLIMMNLALAFTLQAKYDKALELNFKSLQQNELDKDYENVAVVLSNIGLVYYKLGDFQKALQYDEQCLQLKRGINDNFQLWRILVNASLCYASLNNLTKAKIYIDSAVDICGPHCSDFVVMQTSQALGVIHFKSNELNIAEEQFLKSYAISKTLKETRYQFDNIYQLASIYLIQNRDQKALEYLLEAEQLINEGQLLNRESINIYDTFSKLYSKQNNFKKLVLYQQKYIQLKDSTFNEKMTINLMKTEAEYIERENVARIESQTQVLGLKEQVIQNQYMLSILFTVIALVTVGITTLLIKSNKQKQLTNVLLDQKVKERTHELELNRDGLVKANRDLDAMISSTKEDISNCLAIILRLCSVGLVDIKDPSARDYIRKVNATSIDFSNDLKILNNFKKG